MVYIDLTKVFMWNSTENKTTFSEGKSTPAYFTYTQKPPKINSFINARIFYSTVTAAQGSGFAVVQSYKNVCGLGDFF